jgi:hypothetical protein
MSAHDWNLLLAGGGLGIYLAFVAALLLAVIDDARILRRERAAALQPQD